MADSKKSSWGRRSVLAGAGTAGALGAVAVLLPIAKPADEVVRADAAPGDEATGGYRLTEHVKSYYRTAKV